MKLIRSPPIPTNTERRPIRKAVLPFAALMLSCAHGGAGPGSAQMVPGPQASQVRSRPPSQEKAARASYICSFSKGVLTYLDGDRQASIRLDVQDADPVNTLCSDLFTVLLEKGRAVVALGGKAVLGGQEMLGTLDGRFVPANSYSLDISEMRQQGMTGVTLHGSDLHIMTRRSRWHIDLRNPSEWNVY